MQSQQRRTCMAVFRALHTELCLFTQLYCWLLQICLQQRIDKATISAAIQKVNAFKIKVLLDNGLLLTIKTMEREYVKVNCFID